MSNRREKLDHVELLNVPWYSQCAFDGLCAYYTGAMMLSALFPEYNTRFGKNARQRTTKHVSDDPLVIHHPNNKGDDRHALARWFYMGEYIKTVTKTLNNIMKADKRGVEFEFQRKDRRTKTRFRTITESIDLGLPVMLGWNANDYSSHAVLVTGYWEGVEKWLTLNDPGGMPEISWDSLERQMEGGLEIGLCKPDTFCGPRPLKSVQRGENEPIVWQWMPPGKYQRLDKIFGNPSE